MLSNCLAVVNSKRERSRELHLCRQHQQRASSPSDIDIDHRGVFSVLFDSRAANLAKIFQVCRKDLTAAIIHII
jgi:hypothetical protein